MAGNVCDLAQRRCKPCEGGTPPIEGDAVQRYLADLPGWEAADGAIVRRFEFKNYYQTMAFVNAAAWVAHTDENG